MTDWTEYAKHKSLRSVIDPADVHCFKNYYINLLHHKILADNIKYSVGQRILDLGCGIGRFTEFLQSTGAEVIGVDSCKEMLELNTKCVTVCAPVTKLPFGDGSFDMVLSVWTLQYLNDDDLKIAVDEICRVLKPGSSVYLIEQISPRGYDSVYPREVFRYLWVFNQRFKLIMGRPINRSFDKIIGFVKFGVIPDYLFKYIIPIHLYLTRKSVIIDGDDYIDYFMKFERV